MDKQKYTLEMVIHNKDLVDYYKNRINYDTDSGVDLYFPDNIEFTPLETNMVDMQISCRMKDPDGNPCGFYLYPRSSISKTPLVLANSVGIIDAGYRGHIIAALRNIPNRYMSWGIDKDDLYNLVAPYEIYYTAEKGHRLVQICSPTLLPIKLVIVESLDDTERDSKGFGSTGN